MQKLQQQKKCRFNNTCAYQHKENENNQEEVIEQFKLAILKHEKDIHELNDEVTKMKNIIHTVTLELVKCTQKHVTIVDTVAEKKSEQLFQCDQCDYACGKDITLKKHINTKHKTISDPNESQEPSVPTQGKSIMYNCDECDQSFKTRKILKKHKNQDHQSTVKSQDMKCENCCKEFSKRGDLDIHMKKEHPKCQCTAVDVCDDCLEEWQDK